MSDRARFECALCEERHRFAWEARMCCDPAAFCDDDEIRSVN